MENTLVQHILTLTYTTKQIQHRLEIFKEIFNLWLFTANGKADLNTVIEKYMADNPRLKKEDIDLIKSVMVDIEKQLTTGDLAKQANELLKQLEQGLAAGKVISLYFAFEYDDKVLAEIGQWVKTKLGYDYVLEPSFDGNLIAGCALSYKGIYRDASIRAKIDQNKPAILNSLLRYKR